MKNIKKILIMIVAVALIVSAVVVAGVIASASADVVLRIKACNLSFKESIHIAYAVEFKNVSPSEVKMLYWTTPKGHADEYTYDSAEKVADGLYNETVNGTRCRVYINEQLWAKNMTDTLYARAYVKVGDKEYYSDVVRYSILEYAYNKLGLTGVATTNEQLLELLPEVLKYGAETQKYFDYNEDNLPTDKYVKLSVYGGILPDGMTYGFYKVGQKVKLSIDTTSGAKSAKWIGPDGNVITVASEIEITVGEDNVTYTAEPSIDTPFIPITPGN